VKVTPTALPEVLLIEPQVFGDERGFFFESWNQRQLDQRVGRPLGFVQDNHSRSRRGVLRGLHYQVKQAQGKLVRVVQGQVFDVAVDLRRSSPQFGHWVGVLLSADDKRQLWIPPGFAHGFLVMSDTAEFLYKTTDYYAPDAERCLAWDDPQVGIQWPLAEVGGTPSLSAKDAQGLAWADCDKFD
jgi:dTDP-4-dehydrorhamnose 3,5-epimerase